MIDVYTFYWSSWKCSHACASMPSSPVNKMELLMDFLLYCSKMSAFLKEVDLGASLFKLALANWGIQ